jgi:hypothetical protein
MRRSLTRGRVFRLQLLLALASAVILGPARVPWDSRPYFTVSGLRLPFLSPFTTRGVTVEVFDPASTRDLKLADSNHCLHRSYSSYTAASRRCRTERRENTSSWLVHWCVLGMLPSNGRCLQSHYLATGLQVTVFFFHCSLFLITLQGKR